MCVHTGPRSQEGPPLTSPVSSGIRPGTDRKGSLVVRNGRYGTPDLGGGGPRRRTLQEALPEDRGVGLVLGSPGLLPEGSRTPQTSETSLPTTTESPVASLRGPRSDAFVPAPGPPQTSTDEARRRVTDLAAEAPPGLGSRHLFPTPTQKLAHGKSRPRTPKTGPSEPTGIGTAVTSVTRGVYRAHLL